VVLFVVNVFEIVRAWFALFCFKSGRIHFKVSFAAPGQVSVVFELVGTTAFLAFGTMGTAGKGGVTPLPAVAALENTRVHGGASDGGNVSSEVEGLINDGFGLGTILRIPDVDPDD